jgi:hypothetical protein
LHGGVAVAVRHPLDYRGTFPPRRSQALLIKNEQYFRLYADGSSERID